jgi:hypothetical protein
MGATTGATMRAPPRLEEEEDVGEEGKRGLEVEQCNIRAPPPSWSSSFATGHCGVSVLVFLSNTDAVVSPTVFFKLDRDIDNMQQFVSYRDRVKTACI